MERHGVAARDLKKQDGKGPEDPLLNMIPLPCVEKTLLLMIWQWGSHKSHVPFITCLPRSRLFRESVAGSHLGLPKCYNKAIPTPNFPLP